MELEDPYHFLWVGLDEPYYFLWVGLEDPYHFLWVGLDEPYYFLWVGLDEPYYFLWVGLNELWCFLFSRLDADDRTNGHLVTGYSVSLNGQLVAKTTAAVSCQVELNQLESDRDYMVTVRCA